MTLENSHCTANLMLYTLTVSNYIYRMLIIYDIVYHKNILAIELQGNKTSHATL